MTTRTQTSTPALRLAGLEPGEDPGASLRARAVEAENRAAASMADDDVRMIFALRVAERLEGGRAAILPPESRRRLMAMSSRMGLGDFDANLVIAIVQDAARRGETTRDETTAARLNLLRAPARRPDVGPLQWAAALLMAVALLSLLIGWVA